MRRLPRPIPVFWLAGLRALVGKIAIFITVIIGGLAQIHIFLTRWPIATIITTVWSWGLDRVDPSYRGGALRPRVAGATITIIPIASTFLVIPARSLGLSVLGTMRKHGSSFVRAEWKKAPVPDVIPNRFSGGVVALEAASFYLTDLQKKVQSGFGLSYNSLLDDLVPSVFSMIFLLGLSADKWL